MRRFVGLLRTFLSGLGGEPTVVICCSSAALIIGHYQGGTGYWREVFGARLDKLPFANTIGHFWWFGMSALVYIALPLVVARVTKGSFFRKYGMGLGNGWAGARISLVLLGVMLPAVWFASTLPQFKGMYPLAGVHAYQLLRDGKAEVSMALFAVYEVGYFLYFVGWEFLFRGYMLNGLLKAYGKSGAVLFQVAPFAVMHLGKAELEALGSIVAGIALGLLALRTESFWYGALLHGTVAVTMDLLCVRAALVKA